MSKIEISNVEVSMEGGGEHEYRQIYFDANSVGYAEYLEVDGTLCTDCESNLSMNTDLSDDEVNAIHAAVIDWLEANPQPDLTEEAALAPAP